MAYIATLIFIIAYGFGLFAWDKKDTCRLNAKMSVQIKRLHYFGLFMCIAVGLLYSTLDIGLRGLWTTRIVIYITLLTGCLFILVANRTVLHKIEKYYFKAFSFLPIVMAAILFIPFLGVVILLSLFGQLTDPATEIYYEDSRLRVQSTFAGVLGPPRIDIFEKKFVFEVHAKRADYWASEIDSIQVSYDKDSTRIIAYGLYDYDTERTGETEIISLKPLK